MIVRMSLHVEECTVMLTEENNTSFRRAAASWMASPTLWHTHPLWTWSSSWTASLDELANDAGSTLQSSNDVQRN